MTKSASERNGDTLLQAAKKMRNLIKRVHKARSRVAFDTEEKAAEHLKYLKRRQLMHMERESEFIKFFLEHSELEPLYSGTELVSGSKELVREHLVFD